MTRPRARALGLPFPGKPGPLNAITDVPGVRVGFCTLTDPAKKMRTGVTAVLPRPDAGNPLPVMAGHAVLNGNGEMTGTHWIDDAGYFIGPVCITNTHSIGAVHHGATRWMIEHYAEFFRKDHGWAMPVVAETYDGVLNDITALHVTPDHAIEAIRSASGGPVAEGSTGGGNGMIAYEFKGGTGTASRLVTLGGQTFTLGALVQANHGAREWLNILGQPVGRMLTEGTFRRKETGSIIVVIATDAPLLPHQLERIAKRIGLGIGVVGGRGGNSSGDIFIAFSTANPEVSKNDGIARIEMLPNDQITPLFEATAAATEEAIVNAMVAAETMEGVNGNKVYAIPHDRLVAVLRKYGRIK